MFTRFFIQYLQTILTNSEELLSLSLKSNDALKKGIWYAPEYYRILKFKNSNQLIAELVSDNAFFHGYAPSEVVSLKQNKKSPTGYQPLAFALKQGILPSMAIAKIEEGLSFLDCASVVTLAAYRSLLEVLGQSKFDVLFSHSSQFSFTLASDNSSPLSYLFEKIPIRSEVDIQEGDICYFSNIKEYVAKHPLGESRGDYVVCMDKSPWRYLGFGLNPLGACKNEIERQLFDCYNRDPVDSGCLTQDLWNYLYSHYYKGDIYKGKALVDFSQNSKISWEEFVKKPAQAFVLGYPCLGKLGLWVYRFHQDKIQALTASSEKNIAKTFASFTLPEMNNI